MGYITLKKALFLLPVFVLAMCSILLPALVGGAWSPTRRRVMTKMLEYAKLRSGDVLVDLGAGDGRVLLAATKVPGVRAVGIEIDPLRYFLCKARLWWRGIGDRASVRKENFFRTDLTDATVVTFYLSQAAADKLQEKFERELNVGTRIVSHRRPLPGWRPVFVDDEDEIYVYRMHAALKRDAV